MLQERVHLSGPEEISVAWVVAEAMVGIFDALNPPEPRDNVVELRPRGGRPK